MNKNKLGCLTPMAMIATVITLLAIAGTAFVSGSGFFSAGSLNAQSSGGTLGGVHSHAEIGDDCAKCHPALWEPDTMGDRCVVCHTDVVVQLAFPNSLHGAIQSQVSKINCRSCHSEHKGPDAPLTDAHLSNFPHDKMKFMLASHQHKTDKSQFACADCHVNGFDTFQQTQCAECHRQMDAAFSTAHTIEYGENCLACHDGVETIHQTFNHTSAAFQLLGKHAELRCAECHSGARSRQDFKNVPSACESCHLKDDAHQGRYGLTCGSCHNPVGWRDSLKFDHNLSGFKLEGKHVDVACEKCHTNPAKFAGIASNCESCHAKDDKHDGKFGACNVCHNASSWKDVHIDHNLFSFKLDGAHANVACLSCHVNNTLKGTPSDCFSCHGSKDPHQGQFGKDCALCHSTTAWKPSTFNHNLSSFKLTGAHNNVACLNCHKNGVFKGTPQNCFSCHADKDAHQGQFGTDCATCHNTSAWKPASFNHNLSSFKLTGAHNNVACLSCHVGGKFKGTPQDCYACHAGNDKHNGQFGTNCAQCHSTSTWAGATFDHNLTRFKLTGAHANASCTACHSNGKFKGTPTDCYACHAGNDKHNGQFGTNCAQCHNTSSWAGATFDHNLASFKLTGAHVNVSCSSCHKNGKFKGTPSDCYSCHAGDDHHNGQFGTNCAQCHSTSNWNGASINHNQFWPLTGRHSSVSCAACHPGGRYTGTSSACASCHGEPAFHSGMFSSSCDQCHDTRNWNGSYNGSHPRISDGDGGTGVNHGGQGCRSCHTQSLHNATCTACHDGDPGGGGD